MIKISTCFLCLFYVATSLAQEEKVQTTVDSWHRAAAEADVDTYFELMTKDAVFVGSDASEVWNYIEFKAFSKPYFDAGNAWTFIPVDRNVYIDETKTRAWFHEVLRSDHMGLCRGSGVVVKTKTGTWKIQHYVLSLAVPNPLVDEVVKLKSGLDKAFLQDRD